MTNGYSEKGSVGLVETKYLRLSLPPEGFKLENGGALPELQVAYETYGKLSPAGDNAVYICHALTGDAHVAGYHSAEDPKPGWWDAMVGPGKGIDTGRFYVVCANILGGCMGTTGPSSIDPRTGKPYGSSFPSITILDIVTVQQLLLRQLGINRLAAVVGGSLGGMQVLEWSIRFPQFADKCVCIASGMIWNGIMDPPRAPSASPANKPRDDAWSVFPARAPSSTGARIPASQQPIMTSTPWTSAVRSVP